MNAIREYLGQSTRAHQQARTGAPGPVEQKHSGEPQQRQPDRADNDETVHPAQGRRMRA